MAIRKSRSVFDKLIKLLGYSLHDKQREVVDAFFDNKRFIVVIAGRRSGKTLLAALLVAYACLEKDAKIWVVSKTYDLARKVWNYLVPMVEKLMAGREVVINESTLTMKFPWGAVLECKSADHEASLIGEGVDLLVVDEAAELKERVWQARLSPTLRDKKGSVVFISTPLGRNYLYNLFIKGQKQEDGFWSIRFPSWVNTFVYDDEEKELAKRQLDDVSYRGQHEAEFVSYANMVYDQFNRDTHVRKVTPDLLDGSWPITLSVDPGYNGACAMLWIAHNVNSGEDFVIREVVQPKLDYTAVLDLIKKYEPAAGYEAFVCDIAGRGTSQETGSSFVRWMESQPYFIERRQFWQCSVSRIFDDLQIVRSRIKNAFGEIKLYIADDAYELLYALENYAYPDSGSAELPVKDGRTDHPADALRYYIVWRYRGAVAHSIKKG